MTMFLSTNWQILNILIPIIASLTIVLISEPNKARFIFKFTAFILILLSFFAPNVEMSYFLGGFEPPIGIEFKVDSISRHLIIYLNIILMLFSLNLFSIGRRLEEQIPNRFKHIVYSIILLAHTGLIGIVSTGDLFNLYVFIEISSLAIYTLISIGASRHSIVAALDYLIVGTVSATFILVGIGMLYAHTGTLNMDDMKELILENHYSRLFSAGCFIFILGSITKLAIFPLHSWLIKSYRHTSPIILTYIAGSSVVIGFYVILRFSQNVVPTELFEVVGMNDILYFFACLGIICGAYLAYKAINFRDIILYSSIVQMGYILAMLALGQSSTYILQYVFADGFMKFIFFTYLSLEEENEQNYIDSYIIIYGIISNIGLPISIGFFNKINLFVILLERYSYLGFIIVIIGSVMSIFYNFRLIGHVISNIKERELSIKNTHSLILSTLLSFGLIFYDKL